MNIFKMVKGKIQENRQLAQMSKEAYDQEYKKQLKTQIKKQAINKAKNNAKIKAQHEADKVGKTMAVRIAENIKTTVEKSKSNSNNPFRQMSSPNNYFSFNDNESPFVEKKKKK